MKISKKVKVTPQFEPDELRLIIRALRAFSLQQMTLATSMPQSSREHDIAMFEAGQAAGLAFRIDSSLPKEGNK